MVSELEFERAQILLGRLPDRRQRVHEHLFSGLLRCAVCGCSVVGETKTKVLRSTGESRSYTYYHCSGQRGCPRRGVAESVIDESLVSVLDSVVRIVPWKEKLESLVSEAAKEEAANQADSVEVHQNRLQSLERRLSNLHAMRMDGEIDQESYLRLKREVEMEISSTRARVEGAASEASKIDEFILGKLQVLERSVGFYEMVTRAKRAFLAEIGSNHTLNLGEESWGLNTVVQEIVALEPLFSGSGSGNFKGELLSSNVWSGYVERIRTAARFEIAQVLKPDLQACKTPELARPTRRNRMYQKPPEMERAA